jgi:hypothetical protein
LEASRIAELTGLSRNTFNQFSIRVDHDRNEFARGKAHINGIEGFWGFAKTRLTLFRGMSSAIFILHIK